MARYPRVGLGLAWAGATVINVAMSAAAIMALDDGWEGLQTTDSSEFEHWLALVLLMSLCTLVVAWFTYRADQGRAAIGMVVAAVLSPVLCIFVLFVILAFSGS